MNTSLNISLDPSNIHDVVISYLNDKDQTERPDYGHHVSAIAEAALYHLEDVDQNHRRTDDPSALLEAVEHIVVSARTPWIPGVKADKLSQNQNLILNTIRGNFPPVRELIKTDYLLTVMWKKNPQILREARELIHELFVDMAEQLNQKEFSSDEIFHMEMIIGELLSLYPFLNPEQDDTLSVPALVKGKWELVSYSVDRIELTSQWIGSPLVAFGLIPSEGFPSAPPLLLFKGTTYPADDGFGLSVLADLNPFATVGNYGFRLGQEKIGNWLEKYTSQANVIIYGKSLGGALAWQTALSFPEFTDKVMTYGAPGLSSSDLKRCHQLAEKDQLPSIHLFCQENDPVTSVDHVATRGIHYYRVLGKHRRRGVAAHADMYSTHEVSAVIRINPHREARQWQRRALTILRAIASFTIFPVLILVYGIAALITQTIKFLGNRSICQIRPQLSRETP